MTDDEFRSDAAPPDDAPMGYGGAFRRAKVLAKDPAETERLLERATVKADRVRDATKVRGFWNDLMVLFRLIRARLSGEYQVTPWRTIVSALAGVIYFVNPIDVIPDVIPIFGFVDDAAVIAFVIRIIMGDVERFLEWEAEQDDPVVVEAEVR